MARQARLNRWQQHGEARTRTPAGRGRAAAGWEDKHGEVRFIGRHLAIDATAPAIARKLLANLEGLVSGSVLGDAQLLVCDLISQRVRHAPGHRKDVLRLEISLIPNRLRIRLSEHVRRPSLSSVGASQPEQRWELQTLAEVADRWGMRHSGATTLWFELDC